MVPLNLIFHVANFVAPALVVAILLALVGPFIVKKTPGALGLIAQAAMNMIVGCGVLMVGLWFFGRDGKMATYAVLVVFAATSQWAGGRSWR